MKYLGGVSSREGNPWDREQRLGEWWAAPRTDPSRRHCHDAFDHISKDRTGDQVMAKMTWQFQLAAMQGVVYDNAEKSRACINI